MIAPAFRQLLTLALAGWMAVLPVIGTIATTHVALDVLHAPAVTQSGCGEVNSASPNLTVHPHDRAHRSMVGEAAHDDAWSSFVHGMAHVWECCAQSVATPPAALDRLLALGPDAPPLPAVVPVVIKPLQALLRPPLR